MLIPDSLGAAVHDIPNYLHIRDLLQSANFECFLWWSASKSYISIWSLIRSIPSYDDTKSFDYLLICGYKIISRESAEGREDILDTSPNCTASLHHYYGWKLWLISLLIGQSYITSQQSKNRNKPKRGNWNLIQTSSAALSLLYICGQSLTVVSVSSYTTAFLCIYDLIRFYTWLL